MSTTSLDAVPIPNLRIELLASARALGLDLSDRQTDQLLDYLALIAKWNKVYNLTAVRDPREMLTHHLLDSLAVIAPLQRELAAEPPIHTPALPGAAANRRRLLDVGAGAGLPGIVIAICCPDTDVQCADAAAKKAAFIRQAAAALGLANLRGVHARVETLAGPFDIVTSRAFASLADFVALSAQALAPSGRWLAMKGKHPADEIAALPAFVSVFHVEQLTVPGLAAERCIVWMRRSGD